MSSSAMDAESPDLVCQLDNVQGLVDALSAVRWKRHQVWEQPRGLSTSWLSVWFLGKSCEKVSLYIIVYLSFLFFLFFLKVGRGNWIIRTRHHFDRWGNRLSPSQSVSSARGIKTASFCFIPNTPPRPHPLSFSNLPLGVWNGIELNLCFF